jgi:hypothetical protein
MTAMTNSTNQVPVRKLVCVVVALLLVGFALPYLVQLYFRPVLNRFNVVLGPPNIHTSALPQFTPNLCALFFSYRWPLRFAETRFEQGSGA